MVAAAFCIFAAATAEASNIHLLQTTLRWWFPKRWFMSKDAVIPYRHHMARLPWISQRKCKTLNVEPEVTCGGGSSMEVVGVPPSHPLPLTPCDAPMILMIQLRCSAAAELPPASPNTWNSPVRSRSRSRVSSRRSHVTCVSAENP